MLINGNEKRLIVNIPFIETGVGEQVLHFAHANAYPPGTYRQFLDALGTQYRVLAAEHRPMWDDSDPWESLTGWQLIADDLIHFLDSQGVSGVIGAGHSLGGAATFYAALKRPDLFSKLVLIDPVFLPQEYIAMTDQIDPMEIPLVQGALRRRNSWESREAVFEHYRPKRVFARFTDDALWDFVNHGTKDVDGEVQLAYPPNWEARVYAMAPRDHWELLPSLTHPTLAVRAEHSDVLFDGSWALWQERQPSATFVNMEDVGHLIPHEVPQTLAQVVLAWLSEQST